MKRLLLITMMCSFVSVHAAELGQWGVTLQGNYSVPVGGLSNWFQPAITYNAGLGQQINNNWFLEGTIEHSLYNKENLSGYPDGKLDLELQHTGVFFSGRYEKPGHRFFSPYFALSAGIVYWKGTRGEIQSDSEMGIPHIDAKTLDETNWGLRGGVGTQLYFTPSIALDIFANYQMIIGGLYPTMQQHIELEGVNGFQTGNITIALRYYL